MTAPHSLPTVLLELERATRAHPVQRKLLVCPRPAEGRELLRSLSLAGTARVGWETVSLRQLAHEILSLDLASAGLRPADSFDVMALVDEAIDSVVASGDAGPFRRDVPGAYREPIRRTVETLRRAGLTPAAVRRVGGGDPKLRMLAAVLTSYERALAERNLVDEPGLLQRAADALQSGRSDGAEVGSERTLPDAKLFLLPMLELRGVEGRFVKLLIDAGAEPLRSDSVSDAPAPRGILWATPNDSGGPLSQLHAVPEADGVGGRSPSAELQLFAAATPADELREVLRRAMEARIPWDQIEIVATDSDVYGAALDGFSRRLGIPATYAAGLDLQRTRVGRAVEAFFAMDRRGVSHGPNPAAPGDGGPGAYGGLLRGSSPTAATAPDRLGLRPVPSGHRPGAGSPREGGRAPRQRWR